MSELPTWLIIAAVAMLAFKIGMIFQFFLVTWPQMSARERQELARQLRDESHSVSGW